MVRVCSALEEVEDVLSVCSKLVRPSLECKIDGTAVFGECEEPVIGVADFGEGLRRAKREGDSVAQGLGNLVEFSGKLAAEEAIEVDGGALQDMFP